VKEAELREEYPRMDPASLRATSLEDAQEAFNICLKSLQHTMNHLGIPMPRYARVSGIFVSFALPGIRPGHQEDILELVEVTCDIVKERLQGVAWIMLVKAQRAILPLKIKIEACITVGTSSYTRSLTSGSQKLLRDCLMDIHKDVVNCWNFKGEILHSEEVKQLMLYLVQDVINGNRSHDSAPQRISQFVNLVTAPILPPVAILDFTPRFVQCISTIVLVNEAPAQRLLFAYTVDLIRVLSELFNTTLRPDAKLTTTWPDLKVAFETYERSPSRRRIHKSICSSIPPDGWTLTANDISNGLRELANK